MVPAYFLLFLLFAAGKSRLQLSLNHPRILLPYAVDDRTKSSVVLSAQCPGECCFKWSTSRPDVASVEAVYPDGNESGCSKSARVIATSLQQSRRASVITAKEQTSGVTLRCDLLITAIHRIEIVTTTKELTVDEPPERLQARAYDEYDNMFTSINTQLFEWTLLPYTGPKGSEIAEADPTSIIRFVPFDDSTYDGREHDDTRHLERIGQRGDQILAAGVSTGMAIVQARLYHNVWKNVPTHSVVLRIVENLMLQPSNDVYIMVYSYVDFVVERRRHGKTVVLAMPQQPYELTLSNTTVGSLNHSISRFTGLVVGRTDVQLINKNVDAAGFTRVPTGSVCVMQPGYLGFEISGGNWMLEVNRTYDVTVRVYDRQNQLLIVTENVRILAVFRDAYFEVLYSTVNGSFHIVRPLKVGDVTLTGRLRGILVGESSQLHQFRPPVTGEQPAEIFNPIAVLPQLAVLPWDPQLSMQHDYQLEAVGGSGEYDWSINRRSVGRMSADGVVTVIGQGTARPKASDERNAAIFNTSWLFVVPPVEIKFLPATVESLIGTTIDLPFAVKGLIQIDGKEQSVLFSDCRKLQLDWEFTEGEIFKTVHHTEYSLSDLPNGSCARVRVEALKQGHTQLSAVYRRPGVSLSASILIGGYPPLKLALPKQPARVTLASSYLYQFEGGPLPWPLDAVGFSRDLRAGNRESLVTHWIGERRVAVHASRVYCRMLGDQNLTLTVKNRPSSKNPFPASASVDTSILCHVPVSAHLFPRLQLDLIRSCPSFTDENRIVHVAADQELSLDLTVQDDEGEDFNNFTSLEWQWERTVDDVVEFLERNPVPNPEGNKALQRVNISGTKSSVEVTAISRSYLPSHLMEITTNSQSLDQVVRDSLALRVQGNPTIVPQTLTLYNHRSNFDSLAVRNGSGFYRVAMSANSLSDVIEHSHDQTSNKIKVHPLQDGRVTVVAHDLCLISTDMSASATVHVSGIYRFDVQVVDKVQVGRSIVASVRVIDRWGNSFPSSQYKFMNLRAHALQPILDFSNVSRQQFDSVPQERRDESALFSLNGLIEGTTQIVFNATAPSDEVITSDPATIQVFSGLLVDPEEVILIPTATFQILVTGGPRHDARIIFTALNTTVCVVDSAGLITASTPGRTTVTVVSQSGETQRIVHTEATVCVIVLRLTGVKIAAPSNQLLIGTEMAVYATGKHNESPFSFASAVPGLIFHWTSSNVDLVSLHSVYHKAGFSLQTDPDFAVRLRTNKVGQSRVSLQAYCPPNACIPDNAVFTDTLDVQVLESLHLIYPKSGRLLLPHNAHSQIRTNRDGNSRILYTVFSPQNGHSGQASDSSTIHVSASGQITTGSLDGKSVVVVTSVEPYGFNQTVLVHVEVMPIRSLTINSLSNVRANERRLHSFPIGYSAPFSVSLHDAVGRLFDFSDVPIRHRMNRFDVMRVEMSAANGSFVVKGIKVGQAILKMWIPNLLQASDYIRVRVDYALQPMPAIIHQGSSVCFLTHLQFENAIWSSSNVGVVRIDIHTGSATALSAGPALISFAADEVINTHIQVTISTVQRVSLEAPSQSILSNWFPTEQIALNVSVSFSTDNDGREFSTVFDRGEDCLDSNSREYKQQVPFECLLSLQHSETHGRVIPTSTVFSGTSLFDTATGLSYCQIVPNSVDSTVAMTISQTEGSLSVQVKAYDVSRSYEVLSDALTLPFVGAFVLKQQRVELNDKKLTGDIVVSGTATLLASLEVNCQDQLLSTSLVRDGPQTHQAVIHLALKSEHPIADTFEVSVVSQLTGQSEIVTVTFVELPASLPTGQPQQELDPSVIPILERMHWSAVVDSVEPYLTWRVLALAVILLIILILSCCYLFTGPRSATSSHHPVFQPSSPATPQPAFLSRTPPETTTQSTFSYSGGHSPFRPVGQPGQGAVVRSPLPARLFSE